MGLTILLLPSCARIFSSPDVYTLAHSHQIIAVIPPKVSIPENKNLDEETKKEQEKSESITFQKIMHSMMLNMNMSGKLSQEIQEIETTNDRLEKAGFYEKIMTTAELCEVLGVDGIIISNYIFEKPHTFTPTRAVANWEKSRSSIYIVNITLSINDCAEKKLIWNYEHQVSYRKLNRYSLERLIAGQFRQARHKMPYMD